MACRSRDRRRAETTRSLTLAAQIPRDRCSPLLFVIGCAAAHDGLFLFELKKEKIGPLVGTGGLLPTLDGGMVSAPGWAFWAPDLVAQQ